MRCVLDRILCGQTVDTFLLVAYPPLQSAQGTGFLIDVCGSSCHDHASFCGSETEVRSEVLLAF